MEFELRVKILEQYIPLPVNSGARTTARHNQQGSSQGPLVNAGAAGVPSVNLYMCEQDLFGGVNRFFGEWVRRVDEFEWTRAFTHLQSLFHTYMTEDDLYGGADWGWARELGNTWLPKPEHTAGLAWGFDLDYARHMQILGCVPVDEMQHLLGAAERAVQTARDVLRAPYRTALSAAEKGNLQQWADLAAASGAQAPHTYMTEDDLFGGVMRATQSVNGQVICRFWVRKYGDN